MSSTVTICSTGRAIAYFTVVFSVHLRINSLAGAAFIALHARKSPGRPNMFSADNFRPTGSSSHLSHEKSTHKKKHICGALSLPLMKNPT